MTDKKHRLADELLRNLTILTVLTIVFFILLALAPLKWHNTEWRNIQRDYNARAVKDGEDRIKVGLQQIWRPSIGLTDRCVSCHLGMGAATPLEAGGTLFGRHPETGHDVRRMGCTICHRGQGRATTANAAHGEIEHWEDPMLDREHLQASCGSCHGDSIRTPPLPRLLESRDRFVAAGCMDCHAVDGSGGDSGPDLSTVALSGREHDWWLLPGHEPAPEVQPYLDSLAGAPKLVRGKAVAVQLGCRGCHKISGVGGDVSIDLHQGATKHAADYDFSHIDGEHSLVNWHREHLRDPAKVAPGTTMPAYELEPGDEDALITYILSFRRPMIPMELMPKPTILAHLQERRDFEADGKAIFGVFCAACHGRDGRGRSVPSLGTYAPDLRNPATLSIVSDKTLRSMIEVGRQGRNMPAWGREGANLQSSEIQAIIEYLKGEVPEPVSFEAVSRAKPDLRLGRERFTEDCAGCHGEDGEGSVIAPALSSPELLSAATDHFLWETITAGRPDHGMPGHTGFDAKSIASLIAWIREQGSAPPAAMTRMRRQVLDYLSIDRLSDYQADGDPDNGETLYGDYCVVCHGVGGGGRQGPAITDSHFLRAATDGYLAASIILGRSDRGMFSFGPDGLEIEPQEIADLVAYIRAVSADNRVKPNLARNEGSVEDGKDLYEIYCSPCHGENGEGVDAPALNHPALLGQVSDGWLNATIARGRPGTEMSAFGSGRDGFGMAPEEINDIVVYIRSWQSPSDE